MKKTFFIFVFSLFLLSSCRSAEETVNQETPESSSSEDNLIESQNLMTEDEAELIAETSCIKGGEALGDGTYNENSKTWWFEANLNATKPGCMPACVVSEETKTAEINWRCTGSIELEETKEEDALTKISEDDRFINYEGSLTLTGKYRQYGPENMGGGQPYFYLDEASSLLIPQDIEDQRKLFLSFSNEEEAKTMLEINEADVFADKSIECIEGNATIQVSDYVLDKNLGEANETSVKLDKVISKEPYSKTCQE